MEGQYSTVHDVVDHILDYDPGLRKIGDGKLEAVVRINKAGRYEDISEDEFAKMLAAAYVEYGVAEHVAYRIARNFVKVGRR